VHSGWRGTFQKIVEKAVVKMRDNYGSNPEDIICCICPSIRKCHFEVDEDVKELCEGIFGFTNELDSFIEKTDVIDGKQKYKIDTVMINKILLKDLGLKEKNIIDSNLCSVCNNDKFYSYRKEGKNAKRDVALITL
jgi:copper oxidase (laccase) domain-containing protein